MSKSKHKKSYRSPSLININPNKCIGCSACAFTCARSTGISVLKVIDLGRRSVTPKNTTFENTGCIYCGQCTSICPTSAINVRNDIDLVKSALNSGKYLIATAAPAARATLGEKFDFPIGTNVAGKIAPSAKKLGFQKVFDTNFTADMTSIEESTELINRISSKKNLPLFTSCCPAWVRYAELFHPEILNNLSTAKSPQQMMGTIIKTYFSKLNNLDPDNIFVLSIKPCTAKKYEAERPEMGRDNYKDIDVVLTIREYGDLLKQSGIDISKLPDESFDDFSGVSTGAAAIFGTSGGVMTSALRNVNYYLKGNEDNINNIEFIPIDNYDTIKEAKVNLNNIDYKVAVISGLNEIDRFIKSDKWKEYLFIEVMACPGGCINGGGTPRVDKKDIVDENLCISCGTCISTCPVGAINYSSSGRAQIDKNRCVGCTLCSKICRSEAISINYYNKDSQIPLTESYIKLRSDVLKNIDNDSTLKIPEENENLQEIYKNYIGEPYGEKAKEMLHTTYTDKSDQIEFYMKTKRNKKS